MPSAQFFRTLIALTWTVALAWHGRGAAAVLLIAAVALLWAVPLLRSAVLRPARAAVAGPASPRG